MEALGRALGLHIGRRNRLDGEVGLGIALLEDARTVVRLAVAVQILAVDGLGVSEVVVPGLRRRQFHLIEDVLAVVDHLEVAIELDQHRVATDLHAEIAEIGREIGGVDFGVLGYVGIEILDQARGGELHTPASGEHSDVDRVRARAPVILQLRENFRERHFNDVDLGAGGGLELFAALGDHAGDNRTRTGQDADGHPIIHHSGRR